MADGVLCRLHAAAAGDAIVADVDRPDLDNNDKSRPARKSSHHQLKKCFDTKNYYYFSLSSSVCTVWNSLKTKQKN